MPIPDKLRSFLETPAGRILTSIGGFGLGPIGTVGGAFLPEILNKAVGPIGPSERTFTPVTRPKGIPSRILPLTGRSEVRERGESTTDFEREADRAEELRDRVREREEERVQDRASDSIERKQVFAEEGRERAKELERARRGFKYREIPGSGGFFHVFKDGEIQINPETGLPFRIDLSDPGADTEIAKADRAAASELQETRLENERLIQERELLSRPGSRLRFLAQGKQEGEALGERASAGLTNILSNIGSDQSRGITVGDDPLSATPSFDRLQNLTPEEREELDAIFEVMFGTRLGTVSRTAKKQQAAGVGSRFSAAFR